MTLGCYGAVLKVLKNFFLKESDSDHFIRLGSLYGGWTICSCEYHLPYEGLFLGVGVGEDISFDTELLCITNYSAILVDPTLRSKEHFNYFLQINDRRSRQSNRPRYSSNGEQNVESYPFIEEARERIHFINKALWVHNLGLPLYKPDNPSHVSYYHALLKKRSMETLVEVFPSINMDEITKFIQRNTDERFISLLKMDVEGSEVSLILRNAKQFSESRQVLIEFDFLRSRQFIRNLARYVYINFLMLKNNFRLSFIEGNNHTFLRV